MGLLNKIPKLFGYDATAKTQRRRIRRKEMKSEDNVLRAPDRDQLVSDTRELRRNFVLAAWLIRVHLDHVAVVRFQSRTGHEALDTRIEQLMTDWQRPQNCDMTGRHDFASLIRMAEAGRTVEGDHFLMKLSSGHIQMIEGDRIRQPDSVGDFTNIKKEDFVHGVQVTSQGKAKRYAICDRDGANGFVLRSVVPAEYVVQLGYFDRPDQIRGISPLSVALNQANDLYEANEYALAKMKIAQLIGLKITKKALPDDTMYEEEVEVPEVPGTTTTTQAPLYGPCNDKPAGRKVDFGGGPQMIPLEPGEDADFIESATPSTEFQTYMVAGIQNFMKALDIPYSYAAENFTNYSGHRGAILNYRNSCLQKRIRLKQLLYDLTIWRLQLWILDGDLVLPDGMTVYDLAFDWVGGSIPWIDPLKEAQANVMLVNNNMASLEDLARERGDDWYVMMDKRKRENDYLDKLGLRRAQVVAPAPNNKEQPEEGQDDNRNRQAA